MLFQNAISADPKIAFAMPMPGSEIMFWNKSFHNYVHIYLFYTYAKALFQNIVYDLGVDSASPYFRVAILEKSSSNITVIIS